MVRELLADSDVRPPAGASAGHRDTCNICDARIADPSTDLVRVRCNVRRFTREYFHLWRCRQCRCLHCWEIVDLGPYYVDYGSQRMRVDFFLRCAFRNILRRFQRAGMRRTHRFLDYGCGGGHFVTYLRERGYQHATGFDPYSPPGEWNNPAILEPASFDFINLLDVIEHVESPGPLMTQLAGLLKPGGTLMVATPSADELGLDAASVHQQLHHLHLPYHLHIYTRQAVTALGTAAGLESTAYYRRYYLENLMVGMNDPFLRLYTEKVDDTIDALIDPINFDLIGASPALLCHAFFGYFYSRHHSLTLVMRKTR